MTQESTKPYGDDSRSRLVWWLNVGGAINALTFSPDNKHLVVGELGGLMTMRRVYDGATVMSFPHSQQVVSAAFAPDGNLLAGAFDDDAAHGSIRLWNPHTSEMVTEYGPGPVVTTLAFSPDGSMLAANRSDEADVWEVKSGRKVCTLAGHRDFISSVAFSPSGDILATGANDSTVRLWEVSSGRQLATLPCPDFVQCVVFLESGCLLASGGGGGEITLWNVATRRVVRTLPARGDDVGVMVRLGSTLMLAAAYEEDTVVIWNPFQSATVGSIQITDKTGVVARSMADTRYSEDDYLIVSVYALAFSAHRNLLAAGTGLGVVELWHLPGSWVPRTPG